MISFKTCIMANFIGFSGSFYNKLTVNQYNQPPAVLRYTTFSFTDLSSSKCDCHNGIPKPYLVNNIVIIILLVILKHHPSRVDNELKASTK